MDSALAASVAPRVPAPVPPYTEWSGGRRYPCSDGKPMAESTDQYDWMVLIKEGLERVFPPPADVFVAADLFWYPREGDSKTRLAPDVLVVVGRPKGRRTSYRQWEEDHVAPQVVFEVLSPGNRTREMAAKFAFYDRFGVQEYYVYNPAPRSAYALQGWHRPAGGPDAAPAGLTPVTRLDGWRSPWLGITFTRAASGELVLLDPHGQPFLKREELHAQVDEAHARAAQAKLRADQEKFRADQEKLRADQAARRLEALAARLRAAGLDPDAPG